MINSDIIKSKISIREYIGRTVALKQRSQGEFLGLCPFHNEKTPSFTVSEAKGFFHCFGCGLHGDVIAFVMQRHHLQYVDAVQKLAAEAGIRLEISQKNIESHNLAQKIIEINTHAAAWYSDQLMVEKNNLVQRYIRRRKLNNQIINLYQLGYAPNNSSEFVQFMLKSFSKNDLLEAKILTQRNGQLKNPFAGRIIFPIHNIAGRIVGFGGRVINDDRNDIAKYLNSAETEAFHKSQVFYGMHIAQKNLQSRVTDYKLSNDINSKQHLVIVEGYMDVLSLANHGFYKAIAPLGANVKVEQLQTLWKYDHSPIICLDNDTAGKNAMLRLALSSLEHITPQHTLRFLVLKDGKDPDEVLTKHGKQHWSEVVLTQSVSVIDFIAQHNIAQLATNPSPEDKALLRQNLQKIAQSIGNQILRKEYQSHLENLYWQHIRSIRKEHYNVDSRHSTKIKAKQQELLKNSSKTFSTSDNLEPMLAILLQNPQLMDDPEIYEILWRLEITDPILDEVRSYIYNHNTNTSVTALKSIDALRAAVLTTDKPTLMRCYHFHSIHIISKQIQETEHRISNLYHTKQYSQEEIIQIENNLLQLKKQYLLQQKMLH